jgi:hypothetical protein
MPLFGARSREYQNERNARKRQEAQIDAALVGNSQLAQAEERRRIAQVLLDNADREVADVRSRAFDSIGANGLDKFGKPIGTHDDQGRELGVLDRENAEMAALNKQLNKLNTVHANLVTERSKAKQDGVTSATIEQKIEAKKTVTAVEALLVENEAELSTLKDTITSKQSTIEKHLGEVKTLKDDIALYSPGGRIYKSKVAQAEILLSEAEAQKREAEPSLQSGNYGKFDRHHYEVQRNSAIENIAKHSTAPEWCDAQVAKFKESLKIYTLKEYESK